MSVAVPATVAANCTVAPVRADAGEGETVTLFTIGGALTVTVAVADLVLSALLVAVIVAVPALEAAVKKPAEVIVPVVAFQVTDLSVMVPCTEALNCAVAPVRTAAEAGEIAMEVTAGVAGATMTVTVEEADLVESATLVAVTVSLPVADGAV